MTDRREFLQAGLAVSLLGGSGLISAEAVAEPLVSLQKVLVDAEVVESVTFGVEAARRGVPVHTFAHGDITDFWYRELDLLWRQQRAPIAGLTRHGPLFVLERFAWDRGMRVALRGEHAATTDGRVHHELTGPESTLAAAAALLNTGSHWPLTMAASVTHCIHGCSLASERFVSSSGRFAPDEPLYSWVIA